MARKPRFGNLYKRKKKLPDGKVVELGPWWIQYYANGTKVRESSKSSRYGDAERLLRKRLQEIDRGVYAGPLVERITVAVLLDDLLADYGDNNKSLQWAQYVDGHLRPFFGQLKASAVATRHLREYIAHRRRRCISNSTINRELALLRRAFNLARQETPPKVQRAPTFPKLGEPPPRAGFFEHREYRALRAELPQPLKAVLTFGYYSGCRKGEILSLGCNQVDLFARLVRLEPGTTKNDEGRSLPLWGELLETVRMQLEIRNQRWPDCPWLFFRHGRRIKSLKNAWDEACKRAGLWNEETGKPSRLFHDLRRTGVRNLVRAGVPERVAMLISGHKTRSVFDRYDIVDERDVHEAGAKMERYMSRVEKEDDGHTLGTPSGDLESSRGDEYRNLLN